VKGPISAVVLKALKEDGRRIAHIAAEAGLDPGMLYRIVKGERSFKVSTLDKLAPVLGLRLEVTKRVQVVNAEDMEDRVAEKVLSGLEGQVEARVAAIVRQALREESIVEQVRDDIQKRTPTRKDSVKPRRHYSPALKAQALEMLKADKGQSETARELDVPTGTMTAWAAKWKKRGKL